MATVSKKARSAAQSRLFDDPATGQRVASCGREIVSKSPPYTLMHGDAFDWLLRARPLSIEAVVTDPPYGLLEYSDEQLAKRKAGRGGVWRIPPSFDGCLRSPLPRFTVLGADGHAKLREFFARLAAGLMRVMVPGAHLFIATNPLVSYLVYEPLISAGFEKRGEIIRLVQTLRGGDRPKNAEREFSQVSVMPRACWEPWGLFRKPCEGRVQDNLRNWKTGGLRRISATEPFRDVIESTVARAGQRRLAPHPSLKPQQFMRQICRARSRSVKARSSTRSWAPVPRSRHRPHAAWRALVLS